MKPKLWTRVFAGRAEGDCGLLSMMGALTKGIAAWFSGRRHAKVEDRRLELRPAGVKYQQLKDSDVYSVSDDEVDAPYHAGASSMNDYGDSIFPLVKHEQICSEVFRLLDDDNIKMVALFGVRGVGKSTVLRRLESEALSSQKFSTVVRVVSPDSGNMVEKIMDAVADELRVRYPDRVYQRAGIDELLRRQSFLLLLDDLVKPIQFSHLGVPLDTCGKVVFTTRVRSVSRDMCCPSFQVAPLDDEEARDLFQRELGEEALMVSDPAAMKLAKVMVEECHGLPLALKVLAGAIKGRRSLDDLKQVATELNNVNRLFRFTLTSLPSDAVRECFLYTALFPKNYWICEQQLMEYWIGEGFLSNGHTSMTAAIKQGQDIIDRLKAANLLEERTPNRGNMVKAVKVLDTLRHMALCDNHDLLVESGVALNKAPAVKRWKMVKRVSLMSNDIELNDAPRCFRLETLFINDNYSLRALPKNIFDFMLHVKVLDLSHTRLMELPKSIGKMVALQYLNLSFTYIDSLPIELGKLKKLKCLRLQRTRVHCIPQGLLSNFVELQLLNMIESRFGLSEDNDNIIWEMEHLKHLGIVEMCISDFKSLHKLSTTRGMARSMTFVHIEHCRLVKSLDLLSSFGFMENLKVLCMTRFDFLRKIVVDGGPGGFSEGKPLLPALETLSIFYHAKLRSFEVRKPHGNCFQNLQNLRIFSCPLLTSVSWVQCLPNLVDLVIGDNGVIDDLFGEKIEGCECCFPKLRFMTLSKLSGLQDMGDPVVFPSLETLVIVECPKLRKLPKCLPGKNLKEIRGSREWWGNICMDEATWSSLLLYFISQ